MFSLIPPQYAFLARITAVAAVFSAGGYVGHHITKTHYKAEFAQIQADQAAAVSAQLLANARLADEQRKKQLSAKENHEKNTRTIFDNRVAFDRVRVKIPAVDCSAVPGASEASADSDRVAWALLERRKQTVAELQRGLGELAERCDKLNIDAINRNETAQ